MQLTLFASLLQLQSVCTGMHVKIMAPTAPPDPGTETAGINQWTKRLSAEVEAPF